MQQEIRVEHDLLGERDIPASAYWGIHSLRAVENFPITRVPVGHYAGFVKAFALVKKSAATANAKLGTLAAHKAQAIATACDEIFQGHLHQEFVVDVIQGGAGTSTNMNANEVIANRALELLGHAKGEYQKLHPIEDVNQAQSTNDAYPTAMRLGLYFSVQRLLPAMHALEEAFANKAKEFADILKIGRTQLQDAVPMTVGQEFSTYAVMLAEDQTRLSEAAKLLLEINLGATAIGTGINTDPDYAALACEALASFSGLEVVTAGNLIEATQDPGAYVQLSGVLKRVAVKLSKICNDLRLLSSGPQAGLVEINLPAKQAGSSIMPGKVNPVIPEVVNQIAFEVIGNDITVTMAAEGGQLQLNAFEPVMAYSLFKSMDHLLAGCETLRTNCVEGITVNTAHLAESVRCSVSLVTALNPYIGYENCTMIAKAALAGQGTVTELVLQHGLLTQAQLDAILQPAVLTQPRKILVNS
jgi:aspartate ammonia-lyase